jgi:hypothetical protein
MEKSYNHSSYAKAVVLSSPVGIFPDWKNLAAEGHYTSPPGVPRHSRIYEEEGSQCSYSLYSVLHPDQGKLALEKAHMAESWRPGCTNLMQPVEHTEMDSLQR